MKITEEALVKAAHTLHGYCQSIRKKDCTCRGTECLLKKMNGCPFNTTEEYHIKIKEKIGPYAEKFTEKEVLFAARIVSEYCHKTALEDDLCNDNCKKACILRGFRDQITCPIRFHKDFRVYLHTVWPTLEIKKKESILTKILKERKEGRSETYERTEKAN